MEVVGSYLMDQVLKMQWLSDLVTMLVGAFGLDVNSQWGGTIHFLIYDTVKIVILLCVMIFIISYIQSYFPPERSKRILGRFKGIGGNIVGALLGTVTPFCACSSIPLFIAFTRAGLPLGVTFSFLISSPMVDIASIILIMSIFGPHVALIYTVVGLVIAVAGGTVIQHLRMDDQVADFVRGEAVDAVLLDMNFTAGVNNGNEGIYWLRRSRSARPTHSGRRRRLSRRCSPSSSWASPSARSSTTGSRRTSSRRSWATATRLPSCSRRSSALPSTPTSSAPSRSPRRSSARAWDSAPSSRS